MSTQTLTPRPRLPPRRRRGPPWRVAASGREARYVSKCSSGWRTLPSLGLLLCLAPLACGSSSHGQGGGSGADGGTADVAATDGPTPDTVAIGKGDGGGACPPSTGEPGTKANALACGCDSECESGFCVDGVCCESACRETCRSCGLPESLGGCRLIPAGLAPRDASQCPGLGPETCATDGTCDGQGACRLHPAGTSCRQGSCQGDAIDGAFACDGAGTCAPAPAQPCFPYSCNTSTRTCAGSCSTSAQCAAGQQCINNECGKALNGQACKANERCASGFCVDGVCCSVACAGACMSCKEVGKVGDCVLLAAGLPDPDFCKSGLPTGCGTTGRCDGLGSCALFPAGTLCAPSTCAADATANPPSVCDGSGACRAVAPMDCAPFLCANGVCNRTCATDADCIAGHPCLPSTVAGMTVGQCSGKKSNGQKCAAAIECVSNQCVDGLCCESACVGPCRSCGTTAAPGRCVNVAAGGVDPRRTCLDEGATSCGTDGACDGAGACRRYPAGTACAGESCSLGRYTPAATCTATGQCSTPPARSGSPFTCAGTKCVSTCSDDSQCAPGFLCLAGTCGLKENGSTCSADAECDSAHCAQGVCCNTACTGTCTACNVVGAVGTCRAVPDGTREPRGQCVASPAAPCGLTGLCRAGACALQGAGVECGPSVCTTFFTVTPAPTCDGAGTCVDSPGHLCSIFGCADGVCR